jgi:hypothetical protein
VSTARREIGRIIPSRRPAPLTGPCPFPGCPMGRSNPPAARRSLTEFLRSTGVSELEGIFWRLVCAIRGHDWHVRTPDGHRWSNVKSCRGARCDLERSHDWVPLERPTDSDCRKCSWRGTQERHTGVPVRLAPGHSPCLTSVEVYSRCGWRSEHARHEFTPWVQHGLTTQRGAWREHRCEVCGFAEREEYAMCGQCKGTGVCPRCGGSCCDASGRTCDLCCGGGDCNCKWSNWHNRREIDARDPNGSSLAP